jgi:hypothetical protein
MDFVEGLHWDDTYFIQVTSSTLGYKQIKAGQGSVERYGFSAFEFRPFRYGNASVKASQKRVGIVPFVVGTRHSGQFEGNTCQLA